MKKLIFSLLILLPGCVIAQSSSYSPTSGFEDHKDGQGLNHTSGAISFGTYNTSTLAYLQTHSNHPIYFGSNSNANPKVVLSTNGLLGINLADGVMPAERLEIKNGRLSLTGWENEGKPTGIDFTNNAGNTNAAFLGMMDATTFGFKSYASNQYEVVFKNVAGLARVGIGTTNPGVALDVNGTIRLNALAGADRSIVKIKTNNVLAKVAAQPTVSISPFEFTYSDQGTLTKSNTGYIPGFSSATWSPIGSYHYVEKTLNLPQGSTIKSFTAYLLDNNASGRMQACFTVLNNVSGAKDIYCVSTNSDNLNAVPLSNNINKIVDNNLYSYIIRVESINNGGFQGGWFADMGFGAIKFNVGY